jgi:hypothetical protein
MTWAEDRTPDANCMMELKLYALKRHTHYKYEIEVLLSMPPQYLLVAE